MPAKVYFTTDATPVGVMKCYEKISMEFKGKVGIKVHFGEPGNKTFLGPNWTKPLYEKLQAPLVENNVLYASPRNKAETHEAVARKHGFDFAPIDIMDKEGDLDAPVRGGKHFTHAKLGAGIKKYDSLLLFSHVKGHIMSGMGGAIKNASMGLASIAGKMAMHASAVPTTKEKKCVVCGACAKSCPAKAITLSPLRIDENVCLGCGKCIGMCPAGAIDVPWGKTTIEVFQEKIAEYAKAASDFKKLVCINVLAQISTQCDCMNMPLPLMTKDIGVMASTDLVAIDQASYDLVNKHCHDKDAFKSQAGVSGMHHLNYAEKIGLGKKAYELITI